MTNMRIPMRPMACIYYFPAGKDREATIEDKIDQE